MIDTDTCDGCVVGDDDVVVVEVSVVSEGVSVFSEGISAVSEGVSVFSEGISTGSGDVQHILILTSISSPIMTKYGFFIFVYHYIMSYIICSILSY